MKASPGQSGSVVRMSAQGPKILRFDSRLRARTWVTGLIPTLVGTCMGNNPLMCVCDTQAEFYASLAAMAVRKSSSHQEVQKQRKE